MAEDRVLLSYPHMGGGEMKYIDEAFADISGGSPPYELEWSNGMSSEVIGNLATGIYELKVADANGCETTRLIRQYI